MEAEINDEVQNGITTLITVKKINLPKYYYHIDTSKKDQFTDQAKPK